MAYPNPNSNGNHALPFNDVYTNHSLLTTTTTTTTGSYLANGKILSFWILSLSVWIISIMIIDFKLIISLHN